MSQKYEEVLKNIQYIRNVKQRTTDDCAAFLHLSNDDYLKFERAELYLSLPEVELLAAFLGVPVNAFFQSQPDNFDQITIMAEDIQPRYKDLRHKMVSSIIYSKRKEKGLTHQELHDATQIQLDHLESYEKAGTSIPLNHLLSIIDALSIPEEILIDTDGLTDDHESKTFTHQAWIPEYSQENGQDIPSEGDPYHLLSQLIKRLPKEEQAELAKLLLNKLRSK